MRNLQKATEEEKSTAQKSVARTSLARVSTDFINKAGLFSSLARRFCFVCFFVRWFWRNLAPNRLSQTKPTQKRTPQKQNLALLSSEQKARRSAQRQRTSVRNSKLCKTTIKPSLSVGNSSVSHSNLCASAGRKGLAAKKREKKTDKKRRLKEALFPARDFSRRYAILAQNKSAFFNFRAPKRTVCCLHCFVCFSYDLFARFVVATANKRKANNARINQLQLRANLAKPKSSAKIIMRRK